MAMAKMMIYDIGVICDVRRDDYELYDNNY